ncbi:MAG: YfiR family protein [Nitrosomonas sp.]|nr:YfiR family protein [Nitrosomonas sp.]MBK7364551.1 YfiR family protein [Nitrosomonas sp.]
MQSITLNKLEKPFKCKRNSSYHALILAANLITSCIGFIFVIFYSPHSLGQIEEPAEYRLKAAFLYNFANFTEWPKIDKHGTFNMCFFDDNPFNPYLDYITQKKVKDLRVSILSKSDSDSLNECHLLYISKSATNNKLEKILGSISNKPVLTVADSVGACQKGVVINMSIDAGKITFEANLASARTAELILSSQLLRFAKEVYQ